MMDTKEQSPVTEIEQLPEEPKKYNKHIDDLVEYAEIVAEKKIRSKNSSADFRDAASLAIQKIFFFLFWSSLN